VLSVQELSRGFRFILGSKVFLWVVLLSAAYRALGSSANDLVIFHVTVNLHLPTTAVGLLVMAIGVGYLVGSVLVGRLRGRLGFGVCFLGSFVVTAAAMFALGWTSHLGPMVWAAGIYGMSFMFFHVPSLTLRQALVPNALQGRVAAAVGLIFVTASGIGAAVGSALGAYFGVPWTMTVIAGGCLLLVAIGIFTPARNRDPGSGLTPPDARGL
jgi:predicted MFS family arabinose efflux permease